MILSEGVFEMKKKYIAILLAAVSLSALFTACGKETPAADETTQPGEVTTAFYYTTTKPAPTVSATVETSAVITLPTTGMQTTLADTTAPTTVPLTEAPTTLPTTTGLYSGVPTTYTGVPTTTETPTTTEAPPTTVAPTEAPVSKGPASAAEAASAIAAHSELFEEEMSSASASRAMALFGLDDSDVAECAYYAASAAVAEEILVVKLRDASSAAAVMDGIKDRKEIQIEDYADYVPEEVPKIENAVTVTSGDYVVFCVSGDSSAAASVINGLF